MVDVERDVPRRTRDEEGETGAEDRCRFPVRSVSVRETQVKMNGQAVKPLFVR
jgi:hypothetical protein